MRKGEIIRLSVRPSVRPSVRRSVHEISTFLTSLEQLGKINQTWHKASLLKGDSELLKPCL